MNTNENNFAGESWTDEERRALSAHIEEGYLQAERGELIDGDQARQAMKTALERLDNPQPAITARQLRKNLGLDD